MEKVQIYCSKCGAKLNIPNKLHIRFSCPSCKEKYEAINGLVLGVIAKFEEVETPILSKNDRPVAERQYSRGRSKGGMAMWWSNPLVKVQSIARKVKNVTVLSYAGVAISLLVVVAFLIAFDRMIKESSTKILREAKEMPLKNMIDCLKRHDFNAAYAYLTPETGKYLKVVEAMYVFGDSASISRSLMTLEFNLDSNLRHYYLSYDSDSTKNIILPVDIVFMDNAYLVSVDKKYIWDD